MRSRHFERCGGTIRLLEFTTFPVYSGHEQQTSVFAAVTDRCLIRSGGRLHCSHQCQQMVVDRALLTVLGRDRMVLTSNHLSPPAFASVRDRIRHLRVSAFGSRLLAVRQSVRLCRLRGASRAERSFDITSLVVRIRKSLTSDSTTPWSNRILRCRLVPQPRWSTSTCAFPRHSRRRAGRLRNTGSGASGTARHLLPFSRQLHAHL